MLPDPLTVGTSYILAAGIPATSRGESKSGYELVVSNVRYDVTISHTFPKGRRRSLIRLDRQQVVSDPYVPANSVEDTISVYLVIDRSERLASDADVVATVKELLGGTLAFCTFTNAVTTRVESIVGGQS